jgi:hypothetical protein
MLATIVNIAAVAVLALLVWLNLRSLDRSRPDRHTDSGPRLSRPDAKRRRSR